MKCTISHKQFVIIFVLGLVASTTATARADDDKCSMSRSGGKWSFTDNGSVIGVGPRTAVGVLTLDGRGNVLNCVATSNLNGSVAIEACSGTYTVHSDCSGNIDVKIYAAGAEILEITGSTAYDDDMKHMRGVFTSVTASDGTVLPTVINLDARKQ